MEILEKRIKISFPPFPNPNHAQMTPPAENEGKAERQEAWSQEAAASTVTETSTESPLPPSYPDSVPELSSTPLLSPSSPEDTKPLLAEWPLVEMAILSTVEPTAPLPEKDVKIHPVTSSSTSTPSSSRTGACTSATP